LKKDFGEEWGNMSNKEILTKNWNNFISKKLIVENEINVFSET
jgi:hypothetical protein